MSYTVRCGSTSVPKRRGKARMYASSTRTVLISSPPRSIRCVTESIDGPSMPTEFGRERTNTHRYHFSRPPVVDMDGIVMNQIYHHIELPDDVASPDG